MKKLIIALSLALPSAALAAPAVAPILNTQAGTYVAPVAAQNLALIGVNIFRVEVSTPVDTPVLLLAGQGLLYGIQCSSGSVGSYGIAFDSATSSGIVIGTAGKAITSQVLSSGQVTVSASTQTVLLPDQRGLYLADLPVQFTNGLVFITHGSATNCIIKARSNTGNNPGP
jgi:hypothetical protein